MKKVTRAFVILQILIIILLAIGAGIVYSPRAVSSIELKNMDKYINIMYA